MITYSHAHQTKISFENCLASRDTVFPQPTSVRRKLSAVLCVVAIPDELCWSGSVAFHLLYWNIPVSIHSNPIEHLVLKNPTHPKSMNRFVDAKPQAAENDFACLSSQIFFLVCLIPLKIFFDPSQFFHVH